MNFTVASRRFAFRRLDPNDTRPMPEYQTAGAAGVDLSAATRLLLKAETQAAVPTGFAVELPDGFEGQIRPRSGLARDYGITVLNAPGTIDSDYRGEIIVLLINHGFDDVIIGFGDRIAQLVIAPVCRVPFELVSELSETERGDGAFGSTGT